MLLLGLACFAGLISAQASIPISPPLRLEPALSIRVFKPVAKPIEAFFEAAAAGEEPGRIFVSFTLGTYWHPWRNLRVGGFYRRETGALLETDWSLSESAWVYQGTRIDNQSIIDVTPRVELSPSWIAELRARWFHGFTSGRDTFKFRPGITHLIELEDDRVVSVFAHAEIYLAGNFGSKAVSEIWGYVGALYPLSETVQPGLTVGYRSWRPSTPSWEISFDTVVVGWFLNIRLN